MSTVKKFALGLLPMIVFAVAPALLSAQDSMSKQDSMAKQDTMDKGGKMAKMSATGCLMQGASKDGYYLKGEDGKTYELWGNKTLSAHVNHKVTVSGMEQKMPEAKEQAKETKEKSEAGGQPQTDLKVTHVKMVSESCS
jgi:hypothetical protein